MIERAIPFQASHLEGLCLTRRAGEPEVETGKKEMICHWKFRHITPDIHSETAC